MFLLTYALSCTGNIPHQGVIERRIRRGLIHNLHYLDPPGKVYLAQTKDEWFEQRLDHFNAQNTKTWRQRYFSR